MSDSRKVKASSVAAFLFMPQFSLSFQHMSFIVPVFMRTLALSFAQVGLLPYNHPATRYGTEGVRKYSFSELMAEAWFTLRTTRATPGQWGVFMSVAGLICLMVAAVIMAILRFFLGMGNVAQAQIFDSALGATDQASVAGAGYVPAGMFDKSIATSAAHQEYAIMILDKMLRQGIAGVGGPLQNAVGALMQIYNTGVMVVAAVILFWIVLSVVVDTAKTGVIGGGRHNMVWAPMRIVFALGLLIPLGSVGFSSGQFMVMKLAEWGSNFGTNAWVAYVTAVLSSSDMVAPSSGPDNPTAIATNYTGMWVCMLANNGYLEWAVTAAPGDQIVQLVENQPTAADLGTRSFSFTNAVSGNLCGTVTYKTTSDPTLLYMSSLGDATLSAAAAYKDAINAAWATQLFGSPSAIADTTFEQKARDLACAFVAESIPPDAPYPLDFDCSGGAYGTCNAGGIFDGDFPDAAGTGTGCMQDIVNIAYGSMLAQYNTAMTNLVTAVTSGAFLLNVQQDGWAGMGIWYHKINQLNQAVASMNAPAIKITAGDYMKSVSGASSGGSFAANVMASYNDWWQTAKLIIPAAAASTSAATGGRGLPSNVAQSPSVLTGAKNALSSLTGASPVSVVDTIVEVIMSGITAKNFFFDVVEPSNPNVYPLAQLSATGSKIVIVGLAIMGGAQLFGIGVSFAAGAANSPLIGMIPVVGSVAGGVAKAADAVVNGPVLGGLSMIGGTMLVAGLVLIYYVPVIPFMRVAFAVLTWMISVFEAVVMVPIAALAHLTTEGEGLAGGARNVWILWLNVLLRPVLTVIGYVGAMLIFNTFVLFFHLSFLKAVIGSMSSGGILGLLSQVAYTVLYVGVIYTVANSTFKLLDLIPAALMRWMPGGSQDTSFEDSQAEGFLIAGSRMAGGVGESFAKMGGGFGAKAFKRGAGLGAEKAKGSSATET